MLLSRRSHMLCVSNQLQESCDVIQVRREVTLIKSLRNVTNQSLHTKMLRLRRHAQKTKDGSRPVCESA